MATLYPTSPDTFNVPVSPTTTPLSSAGTGSRNHVTHHRDLGDAVVAIQTNVTKITHNHSGTTVGDLNGQKLLQVNTHQSPDTDAATASLHHTIGTSSTQSAAGNHNHDGNYAKLATAETFTAKKTFPTGITNAIAIPDFQNSKHNHTSDASGGMAFTPTLIQVSQAEPQIWGSSTTDFPMQQNRFPLPANQGMIGHAYFNYAVFYETGTIGQHYRVNGAAHDAFFYISWNNGGSPAFDPNNNMIMNGTNYNGSMYQKTHFFELDNPNQLVRINFVVPIVIYPVNFSRNILLYSRVVNNRDGVIDQLYTGWQLSYALLNPTVTP